MLAAWGPASILLVLLGTTILDPYSYGAMQFSAIVSFLALSDSTTNPFLLFLLLPKLKIAFYKLIGWADENGNIKGRQQTMATTAISDDENTP